MIEEDENRSRRACRSRLYRVVRRQMIWTVSDSDGDQTTVLNVPLQVPNDEE